jgi:hypothetical protein
MPSTRLLAPFEKLIRLCMYLGRCGEYCAFPQFYGNSLRAVLSMRQHFKPFLRFGGYL